MHRLGSLLCGLIAVVWHIGNPVRIVFAFSTTSSKLSGLHLTRGESSTSSKRLQLEAAAGQGGDDDETKRLIAAQQEQIDKLAELLNAKSAAPISELEVPSRTSSSVSLQPLKVMLFVDGTWLYYSLHSRENWRCPIQQRFGKGWQHKYNVDWNNLPRIICQKIQEQEDKRGWMPLPTSDDTTMSSRPIEIVRVSVFTSYRADTPKTSLRYQMFQDMLRAKYDVLMLETVGNNEKCVDIQLAVDMLHYATVPDAYDVALLLSGDKDYIPAMVRCRQKGRRVGLVSMRNCCTRAFYETPNIKDYDVVWIDDFIDQIIKPRSQNSLLQGDRPKPRISLYTLMKIVSDFIKESGHTSVSSRDIGRYIKSLKVGDRNVLDEIKEIYGGLYQFLIVSEIFVVDSQTVHKDFWVELNGRFEDTLNAASLDTRLTSSETNFFRFYSVEKLRNKSKYFEFTLDGVGTDKTAVVQPTEQVDYEAFTVAQLKDVCREKGLPVSGRKAELIDRIVSNQEPADEEQLDGAREEDQIHQYLEELLVEYLHARGGRASSRDVGRYLTANKASALSYSRDNSIRSALAELKMLYGSVKHFVQRSNKFYREEIEDGDPYEFSVCANSTPERAST